MGKRGKSLTEKEFKNIKTLRNASVPTKTVSEVTSRSQPLISIVDKSKDFAEYKVLNAQRYLPKPQSQGPVSMVTTISHEDIAIILGRLDNIEQGIEALIEAKKDNAKVNRWRFGGSR